MKRFVDRRNVLAGLAASGAATGLAHPARAAEGRRLDALWEDALAGKRQDLGRPDALYILKDGQPTFEVYGRDHDASTRHISWSVAKSFTAVLVGAAIRQGVTTLDAPLLHPALAPQNKLSLRRLLNLTDGLGWRESHVPSPAESDVAQALFGVGRMNPSLYIASRKSEHKPGTHWNYSTGAFHLAADELTRRIAASDDPDVRRTRMAAWIKDSLFTPAGLTSAVAEFDPRGVFYGGSGIYATARDYAAFGQLLLNGGGPVITEDYLKFCRTATVKPDYGAGFWLEVEGAGAALLKGRGPHDAYAARGRNGQVVLIVPSRQLVIAYLSNTEDNGRGWSAVGDFVYDVLSAV